MTILENGDIENIRAFHCDSKGCNNQIFGSSNEGLDTTIFWNESHITYAIPTID